MNKEQIRNIERLKDEVDAAQEVLEVMMEIRQKLEGFTSGDLMDTTSYTKMQPKISRARDEEKEARREHRTAERRLQAAHDALQEQGAENA